MKSFWRGRRVLVTGHTGFKGSWLSQWLLEAGAEIHGYALEPDGSQALFDALKLRDHVNHVVGDIRDAGSLGRLVASVRPDIVFHLAAQPLVRQSYVEPLATWQTNVVGTINLLEAIRPLRELCAAVIVTTDKVYENREWPFAYRETDELGGHDPYSSSKAATEVAVQSWRRSFFLQGSKIRVASARAGNVIGGGDGSKDRIVPDLVEALASKRAVMVRNPGSVRPWQHVLDPLGGYLRLAQLLYEREDRQLQDSFNFGPRASDTRTVRDLVEGALKLWPGSWSDASQPDAPHEAGHLSLTIEKARSVLGWTPKWTFDDALRETMSWYRQVRDGRCSRDITLEQIRRYAAA